MILTPEHQLELAYFIAKLDRTSSSALASGAKNAHESFTTSSIHLGEALIMEIVVTEPGRYAVASGSRVHFASESARGYAWIVAELRHRNDRTAVGSTLAMKYIDLGRRDNLARALACVLKEFLSVPALAGKFSLSSAEKAKSLVVRGEGI
jgi:hypothetical protein